VNTPLEFGELEQVYELLAQALDGLGRDDADRGEVSREDAGLEREVLFLTKLCITLAHRVGDLAVVEEAVRVAGKTAMP
jgi:hypothetical protein